MAVAIIGLRQLPEESNIADLRPIFKNKTVIALSTHSQLARDLLAWYDRHHRSMPWRTPPGGGAPDPYHVWLSEIMLQQTTVAAVRNYFLRFVETWPDVRALADAELEDILRAWAGLGYYARARNLHRCAGLVAHEHGGHFPRTQAELRKLPGIGPYTSAAIASIAFGERVAAVDGNVERVLARYHALDTPLPDLKPEIRARAQALVPRERSGDFAQALMDLGATVCTPRRANCPVCPWAEGCAGRKANIVESLPKKVPKKARPTRSGVCFWIEREDGAVLLRRRAERGLLGGMTEIPTTEWTEDGPGAPESEAPFRAQWDQLSRSVSHTFTHFHLELHIWKLRRATDGTFPRGEYRWVPKADLRSQALPSVMRKVVAAVLGEA